MAAKKRRSTHTEGRFPLPQDDWSEEIVDHSVPELPPEVPFADPTEGSFVKVRNPSRRIRQSVIIGNRPIHFGPKQVRNVPPYWLRTRDMTRLLAQGYLEIVE